MALFCLMTVCVEPSLEAESPGGQAYRHRQIKSKQIEHKACMLSEAQRENMYETLTFLHCF